MKKKLIFASLIAIFAFGACTKDEDKSSDSKKDSKTETKGVEAYDRFVELMNKNPNSSLNKLMSTVDSGESVDLLNLQSTNLSAKYSGSLQIQDIQIPESYATQLGLKTKKLDATVNLNGQVDENGNSYMEVKTGSSSALENVYSDLKDNAQFKQVLAFIPELSDLKVSDLQMEAVNDKTQNLVYAKSKLVDVLIPSAAGKWIQTKDQTLENAANGKTDINFGDILGNTTEEKESMKNYFDVNYIEDEKIDGVDSEHYAIKSNFEKAKTAAEKGMENLSEDDAKYIDENLNITLEVWVAKDTSEMQKMTFTVSVNLTQKLSDIMDKGSEVASESEFPAELEGSKVKVNYSVQSDKNVTVEIPTDYITQEEFMSEVQNSSLGLLLSMSSSNNS